MSRDSIAPPRAWWPVGLCVLVLPLFVLVIRPWVELGMVDDYSYVRTAQIFAATGHVVYNGGATAMLGWQILVGALVFKVFGFSFTAARMGTLLIAIGLGALMQRLYVRLGLTEWNSAAVTLIFLCSPPMVATTFSFMSDVYGMLVMLACCYCCVRALQTPQAPAAAAWVCAAAIGTGLGGTARQIAWLGLLVMVPCTLWLLRRNRTALWLGSLSTLVSVAIVPLSLRWFNRQPYCLPESVLPAGHISLKLLLFKQLPGFGQQVGFELLFLALPLLLSLALVVQRNRRTLVPVLAVALCLAVRFATKLHAHSFAGWTVPYMMNNVWFSGWEELPAYLGSPATLLTVRVRLFMTALEMLGGLGLVGLLFARRVRSAERDESRAVRRLSGQELFLLLAPCTAAYVVLLIPRYMGVVLLDRYLLFPLFVLLGAVVLLYQQKIRRTLPAAAWLFVSAYAVINMMGMHDAFERFRAQASLLSQLEKRGIPRTQIDGGIEFNGWTQITTVGHLNDARIRVPAGSYQPRPTIHANDACRTEFLEMTPVIHARYVVSFDPHACGGATGIQESYSTWLGGTRQTLYAVKGPE